MVDKDLLKENGDKDVIQAIPGSRHNWAELWLVAQILYTVLGKIQSLKKMLTLLDCG